MYMGISLLIFVLIIIYLYYGNKREKRHIKNNIDLNNYFFRQLKEVSEKRLASNDIEKKRYFVSDNTSRNETITRSLAKDLFMLGITQHNIIDYQTVLMKILMKNAFEDSIYKNNYIFLLSCVKESVNNASNLYNNDKQYNKILTISNSICTRKNDLSFEDYIDQLNEVCVDSDVKYLIIYNLLITLRISEYNEVKYSMVISAAKKMDININEIENILNDKLKSLHA